MKKDWWKKKVAYQIYPKSFQDTNGDGIGDIPGIISRLDYLKDLGIDIIWISPMYQSPMVDQGYDVSDYRAIDPCFGTLEDMKRLIAEAKKRDMYILMDLVVNHCSDQHEWFQKAIEDPFGKYGRYFYIEKKSNLIPNNWRSEFGGSVWDLLPGHEEENLYYLHTFAKEQPDLNWENPEVREEIYDMVNWWLDFGIAGFRIDAIVNIKKNLSWENYPADRPDGLASVSKMLEQTEGIGEFLQELKRICFEPHQALTIGEVFDPTGERTEEFIGKDGYFSTMFFFDPIIPFLKESLKTRIQTFDLKIWRDIIFRKQKEGFFANVLENHDQPRSASVLIPEGDYSFYSVTALGSINLLLRGLPFLYQGQETGMTNMTFDSMEEFDDTAAKDQYREAIDLGYSHEEALANVNRYGRDNARTPVQWNDHDQAGFTTGTPWQKVNPNYKEINVQNQEKEYGSILNFYRRLIAFRKSEEYGDLFAYGDLVPKYESEDTIFSFTRSYQNQRILFLCNYSHDPKKLELEEQGNVIFVNYPQTTFEGNAICLKPYEVVVLELL